MSGGTANRVCLGLSKLGDCVLQITCILSQCSGPWEATVLSSARILPKSRKFLGHVISSHGISLDPDKVATIADWEPPSTVMQVCAFLGFVGYYRCED